jgi:hypothetical protein
MEAIVIAHKGKECNILLMQYIKEIFFCQSKGLQVDLLLVIKQVTNLKHPIDAVFFQIWKEHFRVELLHMSMKML